MDRNIYEIYLSYDSDFDDVSESFAFLSEVLKKHSKGDKILLSALDGEDYCSNIIMTDIQHSSIRAFFTNVIKNTDNEEIKDKGTKAYWRQFLIDVKEPFLKYSSEHQELESKDDLLLLKKQAADIAEQNNINRMLIDGLSDETIYEYMQSYDVPSEHLGEKQTYTAKCNGKEYTINRNFHSTRDVLQEKEELIRNQKIYLTPKKLCYSGEGQWDFLTRSGVAVKGKIEDKNWLEDFQNNRLSVKDYPFPTSVLSVNADIHIKYDATGFKKNFQIVINKVFGVVEDITAIQDSQMGLFE